MNRPFDLRLANDREVLAAFLPDIDGRTFIISREEFINSLADVANYLRNPDWMIYQYGAFVIPTGSRTKIVFSLADAVELGTYLNRLSTFCNFDKLLAGFFNPTQFRDTCFEAKVAFFFASLPTTKDIIFSPEYTVHGRVKRPDFDVIGTAGNLTVECKCPKLFFQKALRKLNEVGGHVNTAMTESSWPNHLRLEIDIIKPINEHLSSFASRVVAIALKVNENGDEVFSSESVSCFVVRRDSHFRLTDIYFSCDIMVIGQNATGLLNPEVTYLRVVSKHLENKVTTSVGACINEALAQLPINNNCLIFIGDISFSIAEIAVQRRFSDSAYNHIRAFGIWSIDAPLKFVYRKSDGEFLKELLSGNIVDGH